MILFWSGNQWVGLQKLVYKKIKNYTLALVITWQDSFIYFVVQPLMRSDIIASLIDNVNLFIVLPVITLYFFSLRQ